MKLGGLTVATWYLGGFVLLMVGALMQVGPFAWAAAWQVRHWGGDNVVLSFLPGFAVLASPVILLKLIPRRPGWPFLCGAQDALSPGRDIPVVPPSPERMARLLLRLARGGLVLSLLCLIAGIGGYFLVQDVGDRGAGAALPDLTLAAATASTLPSYARIIGVAVHPEASWVHDHTTRQTRYHDVYSPITGPNWHPGDAVALIEEDRSVVGDGPALPEVARMGPIEGSLQRGALPAWMVSELRRSGMATVDDPVVLVRSDLNGVTPGSDRVVAVLVAVLGGVFALFLLGVSLGWLYRRRKLLRHPGAP